MDYTVSLQVQHQLALSPTHVYEGYSVEFQVGPRAPSVYSAACQSARSFRGRGGGSGFAAHARTHPGYWTPDTPWRCLFSRCGEAAPSVLPVGVDAQRRDAATRFEK